MTVQIFACGELKDIDVDVNVLVLYFHFLSLGPIHTE